MGDIQQKHYETMNRKLAKHNKNEWNVTLIKLLLNFSCAVWKVRCDYLHNESMLTTENQVRAMAWKLRNELRESPWKIRIEDKFLMRRNKNFYKKALIRNLSGWIDRVLISMQITEDTDNATRQDIRKWCRMPLGGYPQ